MESRAEELKQEIIPVLRRHDVVHAAIFGSFAKGIARADSDLDILVEFEGEKSLLDLVALQLELEDLLKREVDVVTYRALHPRIREKVLQEEVVIYDLLESPAWCEGAPYSADIRRSAGDRALAPGC